MRLTTIVAAALISVPSIGQGETINNCNIVKEQYDDAHRITKNAIELANRLRKMGVETVEDVERAGMQDEVCKLKNDRDGHWKDYGYPLLSPYSKHCSTTIAERDAREMVGKDPMREKSIASVQPIKDIIDKIYCNEPVSRLYNPIRP